jgi:AAA family ATP:ADP antiporter
MGNTLARVIDLREGEGLRVLKTSSTLFGLIAAHTLLETARDALFLEKLPARRLPIVYVILAVLAFAVSTATARFVDRFGRRKALLLSLVASAIGTAIVYSLPASREVVFGLYLWSGLLGTVLATQFWILAGDLFTVSQGKRLFGVIGAGGVAGAIAGAGAAAVLVEVAPVTSLLPVASILFAITAVLVTTLRGEVAPPSVSLRGARVTALGGFELLREYPYLRKVALVLALATAASLVTDYLFKSVTASVIPAPELGAFFARTYTVVNTVALCVQLGLAGVIIRRIGVVAALAVMPLALLAGGVGIVAAGGVLLMPALLTKGTEGSLRHSLHRVASELAWLPLPSRAREGSKELLESVFGRGVQAVTAGALLLLAVLHVGTPRLIAGILIALAGLWIAVVLTMRIPYVDLLRQALSRGSIDSIGRTDELNLRSMEALLEALSSRDPSLVIAAMDLLSERRQTRLIPGLVLYHEAEEVLLRALEVIPSKDRSDWIPLAERLFAHPSEAVRVAAVRALSSVGAAGALERALIDSCLAVRTHAAFSFAQSEAARSPRLHPRIGVILKMPEEGGRAARLALLDAIHDRPSARWVDVVLDLADEDDAEMCERTTRTMGRIKDARFIPILIRRLSVRDGRGAVRDALVFQGEEALEALAKTLSDEAVELRVRHHIPRTIARFASQRAADLLTDALESDQPGIIRYKALRGLARLSVEKEGLRVDRARIEALMRKNLTTHLWMTALFVPLNEGQLTDPSRSTASGRLLIGLLEDKRAQSLNRSFRLLQILHRGEDVRSLELALRSDDVRERGRAFEFLDALTQEGVREQALHPSTDASARELWRLAADDLPDAERALRAAPYLPAAPSSYEEAIRALILEKDTALAAFSAYHALELGIETLREAVREACEARPSLRTAAPVELLETAAAAAVGGAACASAAEPLEAAHDGG